MLEHRINGMQRTDFEYDLPEELIAQAPIEERTSARLLVLDRASGHTAHSRFDRLHEFLRPGDLLVLNNTKVMKCRLHGNRVPSGGKIELFLLKRLEGNVYDAMAKPSRRLRSGSVMTFGNGRLSAEVLERKASGLIVSLSISGDGTVESVLEEVAEMPLPPYIKRPQGPDSQDEVLYQTVYSRTPGAVAAPTAGLHFEDDYIEQLRSQGIEFTFITVHTGLGSFKPIRAEQIEGHVVPAEEFELTDEGAKAINLAKEQGRRVIAVGTSCVRALETLSRGNGVASGSGRTELYIRPGHEFKVVDAMVTNFHQPASSLIVLVSAFAGRDKIFEAYREAIDRKYRFLSFGDAMFIT